MNYNKKYKLKNRKSKVGYQWESIEILNSDYNFVHEDYFTNFETIKNLMADGVQISLSHNIYCIHCKSKYSLYRFCKKVVSKIPTSTYTNDYVELKVKSCFVSNYLIFKINGNSARNCR